MKNNVYNTTDPITLLRLKRQEADTLRDVIRSFGDANLSTHQIFKIVKNVLLAQLGVRKMLFLYEEEGELFMGMERSFRNWKDFDFAQELPRQIGPVSVQLEDCPALHAMGVENVVPLSWNNRTAAWFLVSDFADSEAEAESDLIFIETIGNVLTAAVENRRLIEQLVQRESLRRELEVAEKIQQQLLNKDFSEVKQAEIAAMNEAHHGVGGDFYDVVTRSEHGFFVIIADVAGKGIGAALLMANLQARLRALILSENDLEDVIRKLHQYLLGITGGDQFVTLFMAHVRTTDREIDYVNAGHNPPLFRSKEGVKPLTLGTIPLGIVDLPGCEQGSFAYEPGDELLLYTDGLPEQHNAEGEMFGEERILQHFAQHAHAHPMELISDLEQQRKDFAGEATADDDITLLALRLKP